MFASIPVYINPTPNCFGSQTTFEQPSGFSAYLVSAVPSLYFATIGYIFILEMPRVSIIEVSSETSTFLIMRFLNVALEHCLSKATKPFLISDMKTVEIQTRPLRLNGLMQFHVHSKMHQAHDNSDRRPKLIHSHFIRDCL